MTDATLHRRKFLALAGTTAATSLAGCTTGNSNANNQAGDQPEAEHEEDGDHAEEESGHSEEEQSGHDDGGQEEEGGHAEEESGHDDGGHAEEEDSHAEEEGGHNEDSHGHDEAVGDPVEVARVDMVSTDSGEHFEPHVVRVTKGGTVRWTNESGTHSTTAYAPANDKPQLVPDGSTAWDSGLFTEEGATFEHTFETEGVYHYYCTPHETMGMIGSVIVGEPDAHGQPALEEPPEDMPDAVQEKITELNAMCNEALGHTH
jgi:plastocyanin